MKIGVVLHPYGEREPAGLGRAIFELTKAMIAAGPQHEFLIFVKGIPERKPEFPGTNWRVHTLGRGWMWLDNLRNAPAADIYIFNTPVLPIWWHPPKAVVIALDFAYLHPHTQKGAGVNGPIHSLLQRLRLFLLKSRHRSALRRADKVIAISKETRRDAIKFFRIPGSKIETVHLGFNRICSLPEEPTDAPEKFFLFVGALKERKNIANIIQAFSAFHRRHSGYHLLLVGKGEGEYAAGLRRAVQKQGLGDAVHFWGYRREGELSYLYRRAEALIYPSIIEGFGFPILEAMDCGTPVITSAVSSLPEVAGDAALLVDPYRPEEIARAMERIAVDREFRGELIEKGTAWKENFSWDQAGKEVIRCMQETILRR